MFVEYKLKTKMIYIHELSISLMKIYRLTLVKKTNRVIKNECFDVFAVSVRIFIVLFVLFIFFLSADKYHETFSCLIKYDLYSLGFDKKHIFTISI